MSTATSAIYVEAEGKLNKKSKKSGARRSVAILKEFFHLGYVSQNSYPRKSFLREPGMLGSRHTVKFSEGTWHQSKKFGKERSHREGSSNSVDLTSVILARRNSRKDHMRRPCTKKGAPAKQRGTWRNYSQAQEFGQTAFHVLGKVKSM